MSSLITKDIFQELNRVTKEGKETSIKREINLLIKKVLQVKENGLIKLCLTDGQYESSEFIIKANKDHIPNENEIIQCSDITIKQNHYKTVYVIKKYKIIKPELESKDDLMMLFDESENASKQKAGFKDKRNKN